MKLQPLEQKVSDIVTPVIEDLGFALYTVKIGDDGGRQIVQVMAEDRETGLLGIDDCTKISKAVAAILDVEDPIKNAYTLEVSSPGIDRLLFREQDFDRYRGFEVKIESSVPTENGQKKFRGRLGGFEDGKVKINLEDGQEVEIPYVSLSKAKLVLTDELISASAKL